MALQPIYGDNNEIVDYYDDGTPDEAPQDQPEETVEAPNPDNTSPQTWTVPDLLKEIDLDIDPLLGGGGREM